MTPREDPPDSLWRATAAPAPETERLREDLSVDVAVVGAGFTGLRAALALAEAGASVAVIDAAEVGWGASGRNGGQVNPMLPVKRPGDLRRLVGDDWFERMTAASLASADELFAMIDKYGIDCDARQKGWIRADHCAAARDEARAAAREWIAHGARFEFVDGDDVARLTGSRAYRSAVLAPAGGAVQPLSLARGLARAAMAAGARIFCGAPVDEATRADGVWRLSVAGRSLRAGAAILATNGYSGGLNPRLKRSVLPLTPIQIATEPLGEAAIAPLLPEGHTISDTRRLIMYCRREPGGQFVYGGTGYRFAGLRGFRWVLRDAVRIFPSLRGARWRYRWGGRIALTEDRIPHMHEPAPGLFAGLGYNGRGVAMSHVMGRALAERALGSRVNDLPFPVTPVPSYAFRDIQFAGAGFAMSWLRFLDQREAARG